MNIVPLFSSRRNSVISQGWETLPWEDFAIAGAEEDELGHLKDGAWEVNGGATTMTTLSSLVGVVTTFLSWDVGAHGAGALAAIEEPPIEGLGCGCLVTTFLEGPSGGAARS